MEGLVEAVVADPDLRLEENLITGNTGSPQAFADLGLVEVGGRGVDEPVALDEGGFNRPRGLLGGL